MLCSRPNWDGEMTPIEATISDAQRAEGTGDSECQRLTVEIRMPAAAAAISWSRTARKDRPIRLRTMLCTSSPAMTRHPPEIQNPRFAALQSIQPGPGWGLPL